MRYLPPIETMMVERAPFLNIYVEFESLDNIGRIISRIKEQNSQILDVEIDHGRGRAPAIPALYFPCGCPSTTPCGCTGRCGGAGVRIRRGRVLRRRGSYAAYF